MTPAPCGSHPAAGAGHSALQPEPRRRGRLWAAGGGSGTAPTPGNKRMLRAWARLRGGARQPGALRGRFAAPRMTASPAPARSQTGVLQGGRAARLPLPSGGRHLPPAESGSPSRQHRARAPREKLGQSRRPPQTPARESSESRRARGRGRGLFRVFAGIFWGFGWQVAGLGCFFICF